jgi:hypothetical protein
MVERGVCVTKCAIEVCPRFLNAFLHSFSAFRYFSLLLSSRMHILEKKCLLPLKMSPKTCLDLIIKIILSKGFDYVYIMTHSQWGFTLGAGRKSWDILANSRCHRTIGLTFLKNCVCVI